MTILEMIDVAIALPAKTAATEAMAGLREDPRPVKEIPAVASTGGARWRCWRTDVPALRWRRRTDSEELAALVDEPMRAGGEGTAQSNRRDGVRAELRFRSGNFQTRAEHVWWRTTRETLGGDAGGRRSLGTDAGGVVGPLDAGGEGTAGEPS